MSENKKNKGYTDLTHEEIGQLVNLEAELNELEEQANPRPESKLSRLVNNFFDNTGTKVRVKKKTYCWLALLTGIVGGHRFYSKKWYVAVLYLLTCWTIFPVMMTICDLIIALPMKPDEEGYFMI